MLQLTEKLLDMNYLDPAWTNFSAKGFTMLNMILLQIFKTGKNCIGTTLGNGFYNPLPMKMWGSYNLREILPVGKPKFIARLKIEYNNGETEEVITDSSWKYSYGPILRNNVYLGEVYDARKEIAGWNMAGFDESHWRKSVRMTDPEESLQKAFFPPVQITGYKNLLQFIS